MQVCPYLWVGNIRYIPYEVVCLAAELLDEDDPIERVTVTQSQLDFLNSLCKKTHKSFSFDINTELVSVSEGRLCFDSLCAVERVGCGEAM